MPLLSRIGPGNTRNDFHMEKTVELTVSSFL